MTFGEFLKKCKSRELMVVEINGKMVDVRKIDFCTSNYSVLLNDNRYMKDHAENSVRFIDYNNYANMLEVTIES